VKIYKHAYRRLLIMYFYYVDSQKNNLLKVGAVLNEEQKVQEIIKVLINRWI